MTSSLPNNFRGMISFKKVSALFRGIALNNNFEIYYLNCFHSF